MDYQTNRMRDYRMESFSFMLGILSITMCTCLYVSIPCGALAIILGLLSKGGTNSMSSRACLAVGLGAAGLLLTLFIYGVTLANAYLQFGSLEAMYEYYSNYSNDLLQQLSK